jgi:hypothetical protein
VQVQSHTFLFESQSLIIITLDYPYWSLYTGYDQ